MCFDFFFLPEVCFSDFILNEFMLKIRQRYLGLSAYASKQNLLIQKKKKNRSLRFEMGKERVLRSQFSKNHHVEVQRL